MVQEGWKSTFLVERTMNGEDGTACGHVQCSEELSTGR
jgi:hypothetical protein